MPTPTRYDNRSSVFLSGWSPLPAATDRTSAKGSYYQSFDHRDCIYFAFQDAATDLTIITVVNKLLLRNSGDVGAMNRLACGLLDLVFSEFLQAYTVSEIAATNVRPFQFIKFDATFKKLIRQVQQDRQGKQRCDRWAGRRLAGLRAASSGEPPLRRPAAGTHRCAFL
ncbi:hypothetical protein TcBrA4_0048640 [Trypanosoma cruzi]|nr:hypothetical protein TcBrA4_0048640 [Trypanosoma cruzi]